MSMDSSLQAWMASRASQWRKVVGITGNLTRDHRSTPEQALEAVDAYRSLARDLSLSRRLLPRQAMTRALEDQYGVLHALLHRPAGRMGERLRLLFARDVPAVVAGLRGTILAIALLFVAAALAGAWLVRAYPELISLVASEAMIRTVEGGRLWTDSLFGVTPPSLLSAGILTNNIVVSLMAFCSGTLFGLGTVYLIAMNGFMLGAIFAFTHRYGLADELFRFVIAHGIVELSVICLAGAAGVAVGEALIRPETASRTESMRRAVVRVGPLLVVCAVLLVGCGVIEGYVSPNPGYPLFSRVTVGVCYAVIMVAALTGHLYPGSWHPGDRAGGSSDAHRA